MIYFKCQWSIWMWAETWRKSKVKELRTKNSLIINFPSCMKQ
jgi:hypothetical protein